MKKALLSGLLALAVLGCSSKTGTPDSGIPDSGTPDAGPPPGSDLFPNTANSIVVASGPGRSDPEGVAPVAPATSLVTWKDARGADRTLTLYAYLYEYEFSFVENAADPSQVTFRTANDAAYGHEGFGYVVSHSDSGNSPLGKGNAPTQVNTHAFLGGHHAVHHIELTYDRDLEAGGQGVKIPVVIEWFVATGRSHPVWAVTWKMSSADHGPGNTNFDTYRMDTRGPYGSLNWDGADTRGAGDGVGGVAWGDFGLKFTTTGAQLTLQSPWTYNTPNTVNFSQAWTSTVNAEMGIVQTRPGDKTLGYPDRVYGRERGVTSAQVYSNKGDCTALGDNRNYVVPCVNGWPYQLMNYDWDPSGTKPATEATGTKLMAWGSPYGYLGASDSDLFDFSDTVDARSDRAYATFIVLGPHCHLAGLACNPGDVALTLQTVDALAGVTLTGFTAGSTAAQAPKGPGTSETKTLTNGYDDTFAVYTLESVSGAVGFSFNPAAGKPVTAPILRIRGYLGTKPPTVTVGGTAVSVNSGAADSGAFASLDRDAQELWLTLNQTLSAPTAVTITPN